MGKDEFLPVRCITDLLKVEQVVGENASQTSVIREVALPGRVQKITEVDTRLLDVRGRVIENKVVVEGVIHKQIFFVDDSGKLKEFTVEDERFVHFIDVPGAMPGMNVQVHARVEFVGHDFIREIKDFRDSDEDVAEDAETLYHWDKVRSLFRQTVILEIFAKVTESIQLDVVVDVQGVDPRHVTTELLKVDSVIGENASQVAVRSDIDLGRPAKKIKNIDSQVQDIVARAIEDKVIVEGVLHKQIFFVGEKSDTVFEVSVDERFTHFVDVPGAFPGANVHVFPRVEFVDVDIDPNDPSRGKQTAIIDIFAKVTETVQVDVVTDIAGVPTVKELLKVSQVIGENTKQDKIVANLTAPVPVRKIAGPPDTRFENLEIRVIEDKVIIEGDLVKNIFVVKEGKHPEVHAFETREHFTVFVDIPGAMPGHVAQVYPRVEFTDFEIDPRDHTRIRQITVIEVFVKVTAFIQLEVVVSCEVGPKPSVTVYIVQKGDTLFKIAQRFGVSLDALIAANPEITDPDKIFPGQKILIPRKPNG
ncbi:MAG: SafA/ExsA family spore coat assembly protein [Bacillota bacterium]|jgi:spore coat assembly protein SafA|nr:SafA/ExsA family spore coat assembly protein [Bacillota bacterium]HHU29091.1 SafA/ExsA family spore coat assembly protein [Bacillota bacterium]